MMILGAYCHIYYRVHGNFPKASPIPKNKMVPTLKEDFWCNIRVELKFEECSSPAVKFQTLETWDNLNIF